ncbi:MAG: hypothetical protein NTW87_08250 [Planctomycetota bacterium]|nr:hypothetical protein [Planctomycetota bacterium]
MRFELLVVAFVMFGELTCVGDEVPPKPHQLLKCVIPSLDKWQTIAKGTSEEEVRKILGAPLEEWNANGVRFLTYGRIRFSSDSLPDAYEFTITITDGIVRNVYDPHLGHLSKDGLPTIPSLIAPNNKSQFDYYPRLLDLRWVPSSGEYPIEYSIEVEYSNGGQEYRLEKTYSSDIPYLAISFVAKGFGRWRVRSKNRLGNSDWSDWSYFYSKQ